ncbi:meiotic recombination protein SPO11 [Tetranychus urticae]|uniref:DNA topoisomerase (ATP-hydrolyzing) n=1 Tax=Tetranychus urticae TaxID=32264 RepID=T1KXH4_TETUR|nr:meiotic recombination protein SPO11 [Tetranychus urticae]
MSSPDETSTEETINIDESFQAVARIISIEDADIEQVDSGIIAGRSQELSSQNQYIVYSDGIYEGVFSQEWNSKESTDQVWIKLNELRKELMDTGLLKDPSDVSHQTAKESNRREIIETIKDLLDRFAKTNKPIGILSRRDWSNTVFDEILGVRLSENEDNIKYTIIKKKKRAQMLTLLCRVYLLLSSNRFATKRHLYYLDKGAYGKQIVCDQLIEDLCCITNNTRKELHILSCPKGLIYGKLKFKLHNVPYNCSDHPFGLTISQDIDLIEDIQSDAKFIMIVEKDASFQHLINQKILDKFPIIMMTGKGFPDCDTRRFLKILTQTLSIPVLGLFDANPWGLEILCIYRYGSLSLAHDAENCTVPQIRWLGLLPSDIERFSIDKPLTDALDTLDLMKINSLKRRPFMRLNKQWAHELQIMERSGVKAELQAIENCVETYLPLKIQNGGWI